MRSHPLLAARILRTDLETTRFAMATGRVLGSAVVRTESGGGSGKCCGRSSRTSSRAGTCSSSPGRRSLPPTMKRSLRRSASSSLAAASWEEATVEAVRDQLIHLYRFLFSWLLFVVPLRADLLPLHGAGHRALRPHSRQLDGGSPDRELPPRQPRRLRSRSLSEGTIT